MQQHDSVQVLDAETSSPIDPALKYLTTFLANEKETPRANILLDKVQKASPTLVAAVERNDIDFLMNFD